MPYQPNFLGENVRVDLPILNDESFKLLNHDKYSIYFNEEKKLALYAAINYQKSKYIKINRSNNFTFDSAIVESKQIGNDFYSSAENRTYPDSFPNEYKSKNENIFDRGHVLARRYFETGKTIEEAAAGSEQSFLFTNITPQFWNLNQKKWHDLENTILGLDKIKHKVDCITIFSGLFFKDSKNNDLPTIKYTKIQNDKSKKNIDVHIPIHYWKIVYYKFDNQLRRIGFLYSQQEYLQYLNGLIYYPSTENNLAEDPFGSLNGLSIAKVTLIEKYTGLSFTYAFENFESDAPEILTYSDENAIHGTDEEAPTNLNKYL